MEFREKNRVFHEMMGVQYLEADKAQLKRLDKSNPALLLMAQEAKLQREYLWALLDLSTPEKIQANRKKFLKKQEEKDQAVKEAAEKAAKEAAEKEAAEKAAKEAEEKEAAEKAAKEAAEKEAAEKEAAEKSGTADQNTDTDVQKNETSEQPGTEDESKKKD